MDKYIYREIKTNAEDKKTRKFRLGPAGKKDLLSLIGLYTVCLGLTASSQVYLGYDNTHKIQSQLTQAQALCANLTESPYETNSKVFSNFLQEFGRDLYIQNNCNK
ncbi:MAG: hypothetical protein KC589_10260 [Nanoarchaeota archaeon]|nr:hypothetical protein [Nanoarchaeota archaeon]MCA9497303.1 hypothetical protein [Nanoarchaeota archaeon]